MIPDSRPEYASFAKWCHWLIAALILAQYLLIELAERAEHANLIVKQLGIVANHKSIGITILLLAVVRLVFRVNNAPPALPEPMPHWQVKLSNLTHTLLYASLFALPLTGWLMSSASAYSVSWFNLFVLPDLIAANEQRALWLGIIHARLSDALALLAAMHMGAALKHHLFDKDTVLSRMISKPSLAIAAAALVFSVVHWGKLMSGAQPSDTLAQKAVTSAIKSTTQDDDAPLIDSKLDSTLPIWNIDYTKSHITFTGEQAGAPFTGKWQTWVGKLQFDATSIDQARFDVTVDIASVSSNDNDRDETILSAEFFDAMNFPSAHFTAQNFKTVESGFVADGLLTIKGIKQRAPLTFTVQQNEQHVTLKGQATLVRHAWEIGTGDWADPTWVGSDVVVDVLVHALR